MRFLIIPGVTGIFSVSGLLPHRGEALQYIDPLVYRILMEEGVVMIGTKKLSLSNSFFPGHFPNEPMYPGHAIDEGVDLVCGCFGVLEHPYQSWEKKGNQGTNAHGLQWNRTKSAR